MVETLAVHGLATGKCYRLRVVSPAQVWSYVRPKCDALRGFGTVSQFLSVMSPFCLHAKAPVRGSPGSALWPFAVHAACPAAL